MNKRIVSKEIILSSSIDRIKGIHKADSLIIKDNWSNIFLQSLNNIDEYQKRRRKVLDSINKDTKIEDVIEKLNNADLFHISNLILNLNWNPTPIDYYLANIMGGGPHKEFVDSQFEILLLGGGITESMLRLIDMIDNEILSKMRVDKIDKITK
jgi:hypothetical protein